MRILIVSLFFIVSVFSAPVPGGADPEAPADPSEPVDPATNCEDRAAWCTQSMCITNVKETEFYNKFEDSGEAKAFVVRESNPIGLKWTCKKTCRLCNVPSPKHSTPQP
ncbi:unnamed protein product, partial [Mesorhabditis belari]|uniref:Uncharacterized protein n=1 Tax=Mesorhabditis belari TaxID=2138241 RepID=A0AAF3EVL0_9BILA